MARLLEPFETERPQRLGISERQVAVEFAVGIDRKTVLVAKHFEHGFDAAAVLRERQAPDLILTMV